MPFGWSRPHHQTNANRTLQSQLSKPICRTEELPPLGRRGGAVQLEFGSAVKMAVLIEMVVGGEMDGNEFLKTSDTPEAKHRLFSSSKRQI
jgi:hypothetical protein